MGSTSTCENLNNRKLLNLREIDVLGLHVKNIRRQTYDNGANLKGYTSAIKFYTTMREFYLQHVGILQLQYRVERRGQVLSICNDTLWKSAAYLQSFFFFFCIIHYKINWSENT